MAVLGRRGAFFASAIAALTLAGVLSFGALADSGTGGTPPPPAATTPATTVTASGGAPPPLAGCHAYDAAVHFHTGRSAEADGLAGDSCSLYEPGGVSIELKLVTHNGTVLADSGIHDIPDNNDTYAWGTGIVSCAGDTVHSFDYVNAVGSGSSDTSGETAC